MDIKEQERDVFVVPEKKEDTAASTSYLLVGVLVGGLIIFLIYLASVTFLNTWYPSQPSMYKIETTTTNPIPVPAPATSTQSESATTTTVSPDATETTTTTSSTESSQ